MKVTFPHLGPVYIPAALALKELGIPVAVPPVNTEVTLEIGRSVSPEEMCLPFKFMAGNLIQAYDEGARCVVMPATMGPCRLGEYGELLRQVLTQAGYPMEWVLLDSPKAIGVIEWFRRLGRVGRESRASLSGAGRVLTQSVLLIRRLDRLEGAIKRKAGHVREPAGCVRLVKSLHKDLKEAGDLQNAFQILKEYEGRLAKLPVDPRRDPVKLLVTGEIYTSIEPFANRHLEEQLMLLGCSVIRPVNISWWMDHTVKSALPLREKANENLPCGIGGYARETVAEITGSKEDGVIKIMPAGCMPEIVAKAVSDRIQEKQGTRVLHLVFDEMQASAGYETRVEAFVDMLERRKRVFLGN